MRADYNTLIYTYESNYADILDIIDSDIATEAVDATAASNATGGDASTVSSNPKSTISSTINASAATSDTTKSTETKSTAKSNLLAKASEKVKALIEKIGGMLDALKRKLENRFRLCMQSDKGFYNLYYKRKSMIKPYKAVKVISYSYNDQILDTTIDKIVGEVKACMEKLRLIEGTTNGSARITEIINAPQGKMIETLLAPYCKDAETPVTSIQEFVRYIVGKYRGDKKELVYKDTEIPRIEQLAVKTEKIRTKCNSYLNTAKESYNQVKSLRYLINRNSGNEKVIKLITSNTAKAAELYNAYSALISTYFELKLEESLNYRLILRKFYQF